MSYLYKFNFFDPAKTGLKTDVIRNLYLTSGAIDFMTLYKHAGTTLTGTGIQTNIPSDEKPSSGFISHAVDGSPENINTTIFDGLFIKATVQYLAADSGLFKKYTSYMNPNNICSLFSLLPDCTECFFSSGERVIIANKIGAVMMALKEHNTKYKAKRAEKYAKQKNQEAGF